ncbi:MAG: hypothetical protein V3571_12220 [Pseudodesulfovibrio sp.]
MKPRFLFLTVFLFLALPGCATRTLVYDPAQCIYIEPFDPPAKLLPDLGLRQDDPQLLIDPEMFDCFRQTVTRELAKHGVRTCDKREDSVYSLTIVQLLPYKSNIPAPLPLPVLNMTDLILQTGATLAGFYGRKGYDFAAEVCHGADYELQYTVGLSQRVKGAPPISKCLDSGRMYHYGDPTPDKLALVREVVVAIAEGAAAAVVELNEGK